MPTLSKASTALKGLAGAGPLFHGFEQIKNSEEIAGSQDVEQLSPVPCKRPERWLRTDTGSPQAHSREVTVGLTWLSGSRCVPSQANRHRTMSMGRGLWRRTLKTSVSQSSLELSYK